MKSGLCQTWWRALEFELFPQDANKLVVQIFNNHYASATFSMLKFQQPQIEATHMAQSTTKRMDQQQNFFVLVIHHYMIARKDWWQAFAELQGICEGSIPTMFGPCGKTFCAIAGTVKTTTQWSASDCYYKHCLFLPACMAGRGSHVPMQEHCTDTLCKWNASTAQNVVSTPLEVIYGHKSSKAGCHQSDSQRALQEHFER